MAQMPHLGPLSWFLFSVCSLSGLLFLLSFFSYKKHLKLKQTPPLINKSFIKLKW